MLGGYKVPYDPRSAISQLSSDTATDTAWDELFENLHHQGDLGDASYATIPMLVEIFKSKPRSWQFYCLISIVEAQRHSDANPEVPAWIGDSYATSIQKSKEFALVDLKSSSDKELIRCAMAVVALASNLVSLGVFLAHTDEDKIEEVVKNY